MTVSQCVVLGVVTDDCVIDDDCVMLVGVIDDCVMLGVVDDCVMFGGVI